jgi:hypothetical protein
LSITDAEVKLLSWVWNKLEEYITKRKANESELKEIRHKFWEAIKSYHDTSR